MLSLALHVHIDLRLPASKKWKNAKPTEPLRTAFDTEHHDDRQLLLHDHCRNRDDILAWEPQQYSTWHKRLESGRFATLEPVADRQSTLLDRLTTGNPPGPTERWRAERTDHPHRLESATTPCGPPGKIGLFTRVSRSDHHSGDSENTVALGDICFGPVRIG